MSPERYIAVQSDSVEEYVCYVDGWPMKSSHVKHYRATEDLWDTYVKARIAMENAIDAIRACPEIDITTAPPRT